MNDKSNWSVVASTDFICATLDQVQYVGIDEDDAGQRLDNFLFRHLKKVPKSRVYNLLRRGELRVNKARKKPDYKLQLHDILRIPPIKIQAPKVVKDTQSQKQFQARLEDWILHDDARLLIINKPPGLAVHGGSGVHLGLIELIRQHFPHARQWELVHRLDRETSGVIMIAKKRSELRFLHQAFRDNQVKKEYWAILIGQLQQDQMTATAPLKKNQLTGGARIVRVDPQGQSATTHFEVLKRTLEYCWVLAKPITGRTHQIRVHAQSLGCPILGDEKYADHADNQQGRKSGYSGLMLHARRLTIPRENADNLCVEAEPPANMQRFLDNLS